MAYEESPSPDFKLQNPTAFTFRNNDFKTPTPTALSLAFDHFPAPLDSSMDRDIYLSNARMARKGFLDYLGACIADSSPVETLLQANRVFELPAHENACKEEAGLEAVVGGNELMAGPQRKELVKNMQEFEELTGELVELN
jgi:hypothetical protein